MLCFKMTYDRLRLVKRCTITQGSSSLILKVKFGKQKILTPMEYGYYDRISCYCLSLFLLQGDTHTKAVLKLRDKAHCI